MAIGDRLTQQMNRPRPLPVQSTGSGTCHLGYDIRKKILFVVDVDQHEAVDVWLYTIACMKPKAKPCESDNQSQ